MIFNLNRIRINQDLDDSRDRWDDFKIKLLILQIKKPYIRIILVILIVFGTYASFFNYSPNKIETVYNKYFEMYKVRSVQNSKYIKAMENYRDGNYEKTVELFNEITVKETLPNQYRFYLSLSYSQLCMNNEAIEILEDLVNVQDEYYHASNWYLGLSYLRGFQYKKSKLQLEGIVKDERNPYREDALKVIKLLKKYTD